MVGSMNLLTLLRTQTLKLEILRKLCHINIVISMKDVHKQFVIPIKSKQKRLLK